MKKNKSIISMILVVVLLFSLTCTSIFAGEPDNTSVFAQYLTSKGYNDNLTTTIQEDGSTSVEKNKLNSDEYIQELIDKGIKFEVKDTYYKKADKMKLDEQKNKDVIDIDGEKFVKVEEVVTVNAMPAVAAYAQGDTRLRIVNQGGTQVVGSLSDYFNQFFVGSITALVGYSHPVGGFLTAIIGLFPFSPEEYGWISATTTNQYYYTNNWYEVYDFVGFIPMVITESRRTNVIYDQKVLNKYTGDSESRSATYQGVYYEYSVYYDNYSYCFTSAINMYNAGLRNPDVWQYYTGSVTDRTYLLP